MQHQAVSLVFSLMSTDCQTRIFFCPASSGYGGNRCLYLFSSGYDTEKGRTCRASNVSFESLVSWSGDGSWIRHSTRLFSSAATSLRGSFCRGCRILRETWVDVLPDDWRHDTCLNANNANTCSNHGVWKTQVVSFVISGLLVAVTDLIPWKLRDLPPQWAKLFETTNEINMQLY